MKMEKSKLLIGSVLLLLLLVLKSFIGSEINVRRE